MKRIICLATAFILSLSCLSSCGKTSDDGAKKSDSSKSNNSETTLIENVSFDEQINKNPVDKLLGENSPLLGYWIGENGCMYIELNEFGDEGFTIFLYQGYENTVKVFSAQTGSFDGTVENLTYSFNLDGEFYEQYDLYNTESMFSFSINDDNSIYVSCDGDSLIRYTKKNIDKSMFGTFAGNWRRSANEIYEVKYDSTMEYPDISAVANGLGFSDECDILLSKQANEYVIVNVGNDETDNSLITTEITDSGKITSMHLDYSFVRCGENDTLQISYNKGTETAATLSRVIDTSGDEYDIVGETSPLLGYWNCDTANMYIECNEFGDEGFTVFFFNGAKISDTYIASSHEFEVFCSKLGVFEYNENTKEYVYNLDDVYYDAGASGTYVYNAVSEFSFSVNDDNSVITVVTAGETFELTRDEPSVDDYSAIAGEWKYNEEYSDTEKFVSLSINEQTGGLEATNDELGYLSFLEREDFHFYNKEQNEYIYVCVSQDYAGNPKDLIYRSEQPFDNWDTQIAFDYATIKIGNTKETKLKVTDSPIWFPSSGQYLEFDRVGSSGAIGNLNFNKIIGKEYSDETVLTFLHNFFDREAKKSKSGEYFLGNFNLMNADLSMNCAACKVLTDKDNKINEIIFYKYMPPNKTYNIDDDLEMSIEYSTKYDKDRAGSSSYGRYFSYDFVQKHGGCDKDHNESIKERKEVHIPGIVYGGITNIKSLQWNDFLGSKMVYQEITYDLQSIGSPYMNCCVSFRDKDFPDIKKGESLFVGYPDPYGFNE